MAEWKQLKVTEVEAGGNNFIEIGLKQPPEGENVFVSISKGWKTQEGSKRYKSNILFTVDKADEIIEAIKSMKQE